MMRSLLLASLIVLPLGANAEPLSIRAKKITHFATKSTEAIFGQLEFLGGSVLTSDTPEFGGISGIRFLDDGTLVMITDKARFIMGKLERPPGEPIKVKNATITRIKSDNGKTITGANDKDAEALEVAGKSYFIGFERNDRVVRFSHRNQTLKADSNYLIDFGEQNFPNNKGPEAMALDPSSGKLFVFAEQALNEAGNHRGFIVSKGTIEREISLRRRDGFSVTDAAFLPSGDLLVLERYYNPFTGVFMRIRRVPEAAVLSEMPLDGEILIDVDGRYEIDNMEGLAVSRIDENSSRLTVISDDNFSENQRTVLLEFKLNH